MFCKHCGTALADDAKFCTSCGEAQGSQGDGNPASARQEKIRQDNEDNPTRGPGQTIRVAHVSGDGFFGTTVPQKGDSEKTTRTALILAVFFGLFGGHSFYTGHTNIAIGKAALGVLAFLLPWGAFSWFPALGSLSLIAGLGAVIWLIVDIIFIMNGEYKDAEGKKLFKNF